MCTTISAVEELANQFEKIYQDYTSSNKNLEYMKENREPYTVKETKKYYKIGSLNNVYENKDKSTWLFYTIALVNKQNGDIHRCSNQLNGTAGPVFGNMNNLEELQPYMRPQGLYK
jgi:hypothetical protein